MTWGFVVPGQPVSWNQAYEIGKVPRTRDHGRLVVDKWGRPLEARKIVKTDAAKVYTETVIRLAAEARPSHWRPEGFIVVEFHYFLGRDVDCDNVMKLVNDGLKAAIEVDDRWFLPRAMSKTIGLRPQHRRVVVLVSEAGESPSLAAAPSSTSPGASGSSSSTPPRATRRSSSGVATSGLLDASSNSSAN